MQALKGVMEKAICIHGHFYQPPRENPWLEAIELQESAFPFHDWNERITAESYAPNAFARLLNGDGRIRDIVSNYSRISFNFGPTVLSWMRDRQPEIHQAIVDADKESQSRFSGHGSALAQCYNHMIMPLANRRDKYTQVLWGVRDFEFRFGRKPEGMWLPETAADEEALDVLAELGIQFTILSPYQASQVRPLEGGEWQDVNGGKVDPSMPYLVKLPSGRSIAVFFYDGNVSQAVAFEKLLVNGDHFASRLFGAFDDHRGHDQLVHIATDGESYGHHFHGGDMALAYALHVIEQNKDMRLTIYSEFLEKHPPTQEAQIHQPSAWSCPHGVGRWKENCGCNSGGHSGWNQNWRAPLRNALDWLRDQLAPLYESKGKEFFKDPWRARDEYIAVILNRTPENLARFFGDQSVRQLNEEERTAALRLLEMQRHAMLMFTSCGWFFDEISGLETVQVIQYAARALQIAEDFFDQKLEERFVEMLRQAKSNIREHQDGAVIYQKFVKPAIMTRDTVAAHFAVSSLFESYGAESRIYSFIVNQEDRQVFTAGSARLALGRIKITFAITLNSDTFTYAVIHLGDHNLNCGVRFAGPSDAYNQLVADMRAAFEHADFPESIRLIDRHFGHTHYSLKNLFRDEKQKVVNQILAATRDDIYKSYRFVTDRYGPLMRYLADLQSPPLKSLVIATEFVLNSELQYQFESDQLDVERVRSLLAELTATHSTVDAPQLSYIFKQRLDRLADQLAKTPEDLSALQHFADSAQLIPEMPFETNLWKPQNIYHSLIVSTLPEMRQRSAQGDGNAGKWVETLIALANPLGFQTNLVKA